MKIAASLLLALAVILLAAGCAHRPTLPALPPAASSANSATPLAPSPRLIVGRVVALDAARGFAFVELAADAPAEAASDGAELTSRTAALRETARLRASAILRGRTLGTKILSGQPAAGDEVVWLAP